MSRKQRSQSRYRLPVLVASLAIVLLGTLSSGAWAGIILTHTGANDPVGEGWVFNKNATASGAPSPDGLAWRFTVSSGWASYGIDSNSQASIWSAYQAALADPDGWTATAVAKLVSNPYFHNTVFRLYEERVGSHGDYWATYLLDGTGSNPAGVYLEHSGSFVRRSSINPTLDYHTYQMVYDPDGDGGSGLTSYYLDGGLLGTQTRSQAPNTSPGYNFFSFGDGTGAYGSIHDWAFVRFETGQHPIPEPASWLLLA